METTLYLVRHGESIGNAKRIFLGHTDWHLSEKGFRQAEALKAGIAELPIDIFYSSDLLRAKETVTPAAEARGMQLHLREDLREIYAGLWEGMLFEEIAEKYPAEMGIWRSDIGAACPVGGESVVELQKRVIAALSEIAEANPGRNVCIGTHATVIRSAVCALMGQPLSYMASIPWVGNASLTKIVYSGTSAEVVFSGKEDYLGEFASHFGNKI